MHALQERTAARRIGVLFIIGTVTLILSLIVAAGALTGPGALERIAAAPGQIALGALLVIVASIALALVPVVFWPIGRRHDETLAMGYLVFRGAIETVLYLFIALGWLALIALSAAPDTRASAAAADLVLTIDATLSNQLLGIPFAFGSLLFSALLFRARLVPRWLSIWGLVGATLYLMAPIASMFGMPFGALMGALAVQEMVLAGWLIAKGFRLPAVSDDAGLARAFDTATTTAVAGAAM